MDKNALWKWLVLIALVSVSLALVTPPVDKRDASGNVVRPGKIKLGLDLKGGTSFTVQIDQKEVREEIKARNSDWTDAQIDVEVQKTLEGAQGRVLEVLRNRIDNLGIAEPVIYPGKENRIIIQLPGIDDRQRQQAEDSIKSAAFLEFRMVHENNDELVAKLFEKNLSPERYRPLSVGNREGYRLDPAFKDVPMDAAYRERLGRFQAPAGYEFLLEKTEEEGQTIYRPYFVNRRRELTGEYLKNAAIDYQQLGQPVVKIGFDAKGAKIFAKVTGEYAPGGSRNPNPNKYRLMAIVLDGRLYSAPRINEPIFGGKAEISGRFTLLEAQFLSNILRAGSLPAPVQIVERRVVSPTLGEMSVRSGIGSGVYGCLAVALLAASYYLIPGTIAVLALFLNVILLPFGLIMVAGILNIFSGSGGVSTAISLPVLTLPGIAGIALTIGMAIDANVLIFERMREELRSGKGFASAVQYGYERAFTAILDSNITTIITSVILFILGSGPIRGYAVVLTAGLVVSLYTAVVVTRMVFNLMAKKTSDMSKLKMMHLFPLTNIDFISKWKIALGASLAVIVVSWGLMVSHGMKDISSVFGIEFVGGSSITLGVDAQQKPQVDEIRAALAEKGVKESSVQFQSGESKDRQIVEIKVSTMGEGQKAGQALIDKFPKAQFQVLQQDDIGPQIGKELKVKAGWAMFWSLVAMAIYIAWRFEWGFAVGAFFSLLHDALITAGICHLLGFSINMSIIASIMTIVGYSVNDTIVIFDRIRENLRLYHNKSFVEICNESVNETLGRTVLTTFLTVVVVASLVLFGGAAIRDFSVAMLIGMLSGVYSTVYIATPVVLLCYRFKTPNLGAAKTK